MVNTEWSVRGVIELNCRIGHVSYYQPTDRDGEEATGAWRGAVPCP